MTKRIFERLCQRALRLHENEGGFSFVEALVAGLVLTIGALAVAQATDFGLYATGHSRQKQAALALANEEMEDARALNYANVGLGDEGPLAHNTDPQNPDHWIDFSTQTYDGDGPATTLAPEPMVLGQPAPNLIHGPTLVNRAHTNFQVYDYVTWVDTDTAAGSQDAKRVTIVVTWKTLHGVQAKLQISSLFSVKTLVMPTPSPAPNLPPQVDCPQTSVSGLTANFTAVAQDPDGSIKQIDWDFGNGRTLTNGGAQQSQTYSATGTYRVTNRVYDDLGANTTNSALGCSVTVVAPPAPPSDTQAPQNPSVLVNGGATYTRYLQVTLNLSATDNVAVTQVRMSDNGSTFGSWVPYSTSVIYSIPSGDGVKNVSVQFRDAAGNVSTTVSDSIILDTGPPPAPTGLTVIRSSNKKEATLQWTSVIASDLAGYAIYRRLTTSNTFAQVSCSFQYGLPNKCLDKATDNKGTYVWYVVAVDRAANVSGPSNLVTR